jgi:hypothetical protein
LHLAYWEGTRYTRNESLVPSNEHYDHSSDGDDGDDDFIFHPLVEMPLATLVSTVDKDGTIILEADDPMDPVLGLPLCHDGHYAHT